MVLTTHISQPFAALLINEISSNISFPKTGRATMVILIPVCISKKAFAKTPFRICENLRELVSLGNFLGTLKIFFIQHAQIFQCESIRVEALHHLFSNRKGKAHQFAGHQVLLRFPEYFYPHLNR